MPPKKKKKTSSDEESVSDNNNNVVADNIDDDLWGEEEENEEEDDEEYSSKNSSKKKKGQKGGKSKVSDTESDSDTVGRKRIKKKSFISDVVEDEEGEEEYGNNNNNNNNGSESEFDETEFDDGFDADLMGDDNDRSALEAMPQLEREKILFERGERRQELQDRKAAKLAARAAAGKSIKSKQSKPTTRGRTRSATQTNKSAKQQKNDALADLLARKHGKVAGKISESIELEDEEDEYYDESEEEPSRRNKKNKAKARKRAAARAQDEELYEEEAEEDNEQQVNEFGEDIEQKRSPIRLQDILNLQLRRDGVERIFEEPYFNDFAVGMFARVSVGQRDDGSVAYRLCQVKEIKDFKHVYRFGNKMTKIAFNLAHGKSERIFQLSQLSNHSVLEPEFKRWLETMERENIPILSMEEAIAKNKRALQIKEGFTYTPEIMAKIIEERKAKQGLLSASNLAAEKIRINYALQTAIQRKNTEETAKLTRLLEELEEKEKKVLVKKAQKQVIGILAINKKNQELNDIQLEEMIKLEREEKKKNIGKEEKIDAFKRRATRPQMNWAVDEENTEDKKKNTSNNTTTTTSSSTVKEETKTNPIPTTIKEEKAIAMDIEPDSTNENVPISIENGHTTNNNITTNNGIVPPSKVNPNLLPAYCVEFPHVDYSSANRELLSNLHNFKLNIDLNNSKRAPPPIIPRRIGPYNQLPPGYKAVSLDEYWRRRDEEEQEMDTH